MSEALTMPATDTEPGELARFRRHAVWFVLIGLLIHAALYAASERLVLEHGAKNRFHKIATTPPTTYDVAILGASHAMPLDFADMNERVGKRVGGPVTNLSIEGAGIVVDRLMLDYFLARHKANRVVLFLDSFAFYSPKWNEERLDDTRLFLRAPFDPVLLRLLWERPSARKVALNWASGFMKIANPNRFQPEISEAEATRFTRVYRPVAQLDRQRIEYLYPRVVDEAVFARYRAELEGLVATAKAGGAAVLLVKPPTPARYRDKLPAEPAFDETMRKLAEATGATFHDLSTAVTEDRFFYDTDHLNQAGTVAFIEGAFGTLLAEKP